MKIFTENVSGLLAVVAIACAAAVWLWSQEEAPVVLTPIGNMTLPGSHSLQTTVGVIAGKELVVSFVNKDGSPPHPPLESKHCTSRFPRGYGLDDEGIVRKPDDGAGVNGLQAANRLGHAWTACTQFLHWGVVLVTVLDDKSGDILWTSKLPQKYPIHDRSIPGEGGLLYLRDFEDAQRVSITITSYLPVSRAGATSTEYAFNYRWRERGSR